MNAGTIDLVEINYIVILFIFFFFRSQEENLSCLFTGRKAVFEEAFSH